MSTFKVVLMSRLADSRMIVTFTNVRAEDKAAAEVVALDHMATPHHWMMLEVTQSGWQ